MIWVIIGFVLLIYVGYKAEESVAEGKRSRGILAWGTYEYCGGNDKIIQNCKVDLSWMDRRENILIIEYKITGEHLIERISYDNIIKLSVKTESDIRSDVTLTRLAILGIFALGMKKDKEVNRNFLVVKYINEDGDEQNLILGRVNQNELNSFNKILKDYKTLK